MSTADEMMKKLHQEQCERIARPGDKLFVIEDEVVYDPDDDYYGIYVPNKVKEKIVREVKCSDGYYVIWFTDDTSRICTRVYKTFDEANSVMRRKRKEIWEENNLNQMLETLLKIKKDIEAD